VVKLRRQHLLWSTCRCKTFSKSEFGTKFPTEILFFGDIQIPLQHTTTSILRPFFRDHPGEPVPEENFWTLCCKGRLTEADTPTIRLVATPSITNSAHLHHLPNFFTGQMPFLPPNQQCQSTEGLAHSDLGEDARVLLNGVTCTVSVP